MGCDRCIQCISRAILKPVHQFGIPNSDPKTPKSIKINSSKNRQTTVHALVPQCFELLKMQYSQKFSGPSPLDQSGEGLQCTPSHLCLQTSQLHKGFCPHQVCQKASTPPQQKNAGYGTGTWNFFIRSKQCHGICLLHLSITYCIVYM